MMPLMHQIEEFKIIEDHKKSKGKGTKVNGKKKAKKEEIVEENIEEKPKPPQFVTKDKIIIKTPEGDQFIFMDKEWTNILKNGEVSVENLESGEIEQKDSILTLTRSSAPMEKYPFTEIRDDELKTINLSETEKVVCYPDNLQFYKEGELIRIQKKKDPVFLIRKTKNNLNKWFEADYLEKFHETYTEIKIHPEIEFLILKRKEINQEDNFIVIIKREKDLFMIKGNGQAYYLQNTFIDQYRTDVGSLIQRKKNLDYFLYELKKLNINLKKLEIKFAKSKKKKKRDLEKNNNLKKQIIAEFSDRIQEFIGVKDKKEEEVENKEEEEEIQNSSLKEKESDDEELGEKSVQFTVDLLPGYNETL